MAITLPYSEVDGTVASGAQMQANLNVLLAAANLAFNKDGSTPPTNNIPMAGFNFTGLGASADLGSAITRGQLTGPGASGLIGSLKTVVSAADYLVGGLVTVASINNAVAYLTAIGGGVLVLPWGAHSLASTDLAVPILLTSNITVDGSAASLTVTGAGIIGSLFRAVNASNVVIRNLSAIGNSQAVADASSGAFFNFLQDNSGTGCENIRVENVRLQNFAAERWVSVVNSNGSAKTIRDVRLNNISAFSVSTANNLGGAAIGIGSSVIMVFGNTAPIIDVEITKLYVDATYIKCGATIFHAVQGVVINNPHVINAGLTGTSDDKGAYAINVYGNSGEIGNITINDALISAPRSCGIYLRGVQIANVKNPQISGQTDVNAGTLPKGAIALDGSADVTVTGGKLSGNYFDFMAAADTASTNFRIALRGVQMIGTVGYSVNINPTTGAGSPDRLTIDSCDIDSNAQGIAIFNNIAAGARNIKNVSIRGGSIIARGGTAISLNPNGGAVLTNYQISGMAIAATNRGIDADSATGDLRISNVTIEDAGSTALVYGIIARNFPQLNIEGVLIRGMGTGYATLTDGANGNIRSLRIYNVVNGYSPSSLGMIAPTIGGTQGWYVENLNPVEAGVAASKYVNEGWLYSGSWLPQRRLTGN